MEQDNEEKDKKIKIETKDLPDMIQKLFNVSQKYEKFLIKVYETSPNPTGRGNVSKQFLDQFDNEYVDHQFVKEYFGPGTYETQLLVNGSSITTSRINIAGVPWEEVEQRKNSRVSGGGDLDGLIRLISGIAPHLATVIASFKASRDPLERMNGFFEKVATSRLKSIDSFEQRIGSLMDRVGKQALPKPTNTAETSFPQEVVTKIIDTLSGFFPSYKSGSETAKNMYAEGVKEEMKNNPESAELINDGNFWIALHDKACKDPKIGKDAFEDLMTRAGVKFEFPNIQTQTQEA